MGQRRVGCVVRPLWFCKKLKFRCSYMFVGLKFIRRIINIRTLIDPVREKRKKAAKLLVAGGLYFNGVVESWIACKVFSFLLFGPTGFHHLTLHFLLLFSKFEMFKRIKLLEGLSFLSLPSNLSKPIKTSY